MWTNVNSIPADLRRSPQITRIIVWDNTPRTAAAAAAARSDNDRAQSLLGDGWKRVDEQLYPVRDHWTWRQMIHVRRRVYERRPAGSTQPTTRASSRPTTIPL